MIRFRFDSQLRRFIKRLSRIRSTKMHATKPTIGYAFLVPEIRYYQLHKMDDRQLPRTNGPNTCRILLLHSEVFRHSPLRGTHSGMQLVEPELDDLSRKFHRRLRKVPCPAHHCQPASLKVWQGEWSVRNVMRQIPDVSSVTLMPSREMAHEHRPLLHSGSYMPASAMMLRQSSTHKRLPLRLQERPFAPVLPFACA